MQRSLKHEYELYVDQEIEHYKDSIPRSAILRIGDEAVCVLRDAEQPGFDELLLCTEVDRIIRRRLRVPTYATWRRRRLRLIAEYRRPERWGLTADAPLVREIPADSEAHVLVIGAGEEGTTLYLAANGCQVTAIEEDPEAVERVMIAAGQVGLTSRVCGQVSALRSWYPDAPLHAVVSSPAAFAGLSAEERGRVIEILKSATLDGGVHLVQTIVTGDSAMSHDELRRQYRGWDVALVRDGTFMARKFSPPPSGQTQPSV
ncbi:MAG: SAM-dependent methyltransferase [Gemmatimonadota bacterium]